MLKTDKILMLYFWYTAYFPCTKAIPVLKELQKKYTNEIQLIGKNPFEEKVKNKSRIEAFLKRTLVAYPIFFISEMPVVLNIRASPTICVIAKDRKVKFAKFAMAEDMFEEMDNDIQEVLIKN